MKSTQSNDLLAVTHFLYEMGILAKTPRSAFPFLGSGNQSVAEHINRTCYIGLAMAQLEKTVDCAKVVLICLLHDIAETRSGDLNYVHQQYVKVDEEKILAELLAPLPFAGYMQAIFTGYKLRQSKEAILAKDADNLEWIMTLKEQSDLGNKRADVMIQNAVQRLKTNIARELAQKILKTESTAWYAAKKDNSWWINRTVSK